MKRIGFAVIFLLFPALASAQRLPRTVIPQHYELRLTPNFQTDSFSGEERIRVSVQQPVREVFLHALEIELNSVTITAGGTTQNAKVTLDPKAEWAVLSVDKPLPPGDAIIDIRYTGILNNSLHGFYLGKMNGRKYAASQMESTDARRAFPSFDEPGMKATFDIALTVDKGDTAFSNGAVISDTPGPGANKHTLRFATTPRLSSYLVALVVGDFQCIRDEFDGIPLGICASPDKIALGKYAMEATKEVLRYFNDYFGIKYPFGKLDQIAIPDFRAGAMENAGAVIYRETALLLDEKNSRVERRQGVAGVIAHEIAHMWFGDLVTMAWWDDIWLNEGFATWASSKPLDRWKPEWKYPIRRVSGTSGPISTDVLQSTRPIRMQAESTDQIEELFDSIAYGKTAALLRMIESYLGEETFRKGVNRYLSKHAWGNTSASDFSDALSAAAGKPIDEIITSYIKQPGVPIVEMSSRCDGNKTVVTLRQKRFFVDPAKRKKDSDQLWKIPVCYDAAGRSDCRLMTERQESFEIGGCNAPIVMNANGLGYYITSYAGNDRKRVLDPRGKLSSAQKIALNRDEWLLVRTGEQSIADYLDFSATLLADEESSLAQDALDTLATVESYYVAPEQAGRYRKLLASAVRPLATKLGWKPGVDEPDDVKTLRASVLKTLGINAFDEQVRRAARPLADAYLADRNAVDASLAGTVLELAAVDGDAALYEKYLEAYRSSKEPNQRSQFLSSLAAFRDPKLIQRTLELALTDEVRNQDAGGLLSAVVFSRFGRDQGWKFVTTRWKDISKKLPPRMRGGVLTSGRAYCDPQHLEEVKLFQAAHPEPSAERAMRQSVERIDNCITFKTLQGERLANWINAKK